MWESTTKHVPFECCSSALPQQCHTRYQNYHAQYHQALADSKGGSRGPGVHAPPSLACAIFFARGCWRSDIPSSLHPSALSTELLKVSELPHLSLTLTLAQPRCNCKCNLTLTLDSRYNGRHALAWEYQR